MSLVCSRSRFGLIFSIAYKVLSNYCTTILHISRGFRPSFCSRPGSDEGW